MVTEKTPYHRSFSQLSTYGECPERYFLSRMVKPRLPERPAAWTARGSALHETFEAWERSGRTTDVEEDYVKNFTRHIDRFKIDQPDLNQWFITPRVKGVERDIELRLKDGLEQTRTYKQRCLDAEWRVFTFPDGSPALELEFQITIGDVPVRGAIDVIEEWEDGRLTLKDLKTGSKVKVDPRQLGLYRYAMEEVYGLEIHYGRFWYTKLDRAEWFDLRRASNKDTLIREFSALSRGINTNVFLANPGDNCKFCSVQRWCSVMGTENVERKY